MARPKRKIRPDSGSENSGPSALGQWLEFVRNERAFDATEKHDLSIALIEAIQDAAGGRELVFTCQFAKDGSLPGEGNIKFLLGKVLKEIGFTMVRRVPVPGSASGASHYALNDQINISLFIINQDNKNWLKIRSYADKSEMFSDTADVVTLKGGRLTPRYDTVAPEDIRVGIASDGNLSGITLEELEDLGGSAEERRVGLDTFESLRKSLIEEFRFSAEQTEENIAGIVEHIRNMQISTLQVPETKYVPRQDFIIDFLRENWKDWLELDALTMPVLRQNDFKAYTAVNNYIKHSKLPDDIKLPSKSEVLAREVADPRKVREAGRINSSAWRLRQRSPE